MSDYDEKPALKAEDDDTIELDRDNGSNPWKRPASQPPADDSSQISAPPAKRVKTNIQTDAASRQRGARMFGLLKGTLSKFQDDSSKTAKSDSMKRRAAIESRLQEKLKAEQDVSSKKSERAKLEKSLRLDVNRKMDEKGLLDAIVRL